MIISRFGRSAFEVMRSRVCKQMNLSSSSLLLQEEAVALASPKDEGEQRTVFIQNDQQAIQLLSRYLTPSRPPAPVPGGRSDVKAVYINGYKKDGFFFVKDSIKHGYGWCQNWFTFDSVGNVYRQPPKGDHSECSIFYQEKYSREFKEMISTEYHVVFAADEGIVENFCPKFNLKDLEPSEIQEIFARYHFHLDELEPNNSYFYFNTQQNGVQADLIPPSTKCTNKHNIFCNYIVYSYEFEGQRTFLVPQPTSASCGASSIAMLALSHGISNAPVALSGMWQSDVVRMIKRFIVEPLNRRHAKQYFLICKSLEEDLVSEDESLDDSTSPDDEVIETVDTREELIEQMALHFQKSQAPLIADVGGHYLIVDNINCEENFAIIRDPLFAIHAKVDLDFLQRNMTIFFGVEKNDLPHP